MWTIQLLQGDFGVWGGYGFDVSLGISSAIPGLPFPLSASAALELGLVFSARPENPSLPHGMQVTDQFLGIRFGVGVSVGMTWPRSTISFSRSCGYIKSVEHGKNNARCSTNRAGDKIREERSFWHRIGDDWTDLYKRCKRAWSCRYKPCKDLASKSTPKQKHCKRNRVAFRGLRSSTNWSKCFRPNVDKPSTWQCISSMIPFTTVNCTQ